MRKVVGFLSAVGLRCGALTVMLVVSMISAVAAKMRAFRVLWFSILSMYSPKGWASSFPLGMLSQFSRVSKSMYLRGAMEWL